jgi:hypothetical protein
MSEYICKNLFDTDMMNDCSSFDTLIGNIIDRAYASGKDWIATRDGIGTNISYFLGDLNLENTNDDEDDENDDTEQEFYDDEEDYDDDYWDDEEDY